MSSDHVIEVNELSKNYRIFKRPQDRLAQGALNFLARCLRSGKRSEALYQQARDIAHVHLALDAVSFSVRRGESLAVIGRNGSGKSTLLQLICGTLAPSGGTLRVAGRVAALLELGSGFNPEFSGRENVYLNGQLLGLSRREIESRFDSIAAFADIGKFLDEPIRTYSSGMFLRLAFAVVAHVDADILIIDEALAVGDAAFTQKCMRFLRDFMKRGTLLFVSHDLGSVKGLCERAIWLDYGKLQMDASAKEVADAYLRKLFETNQGASAEVPADRPASHKPVRHLRDRRLELLHQSSLRNDLHVVKFEPDASGFGLGAARISDVGFIDEDGHAVNMIVGGESVRLSVRVAALRSLFGPIVGFFVRDRLGQELFGDNTFVSSQSSPLTIAEGEGFEAVFEFEMPRLPRGQYSIVVGVAEGTQTEHVQHHWLNEAVLFESHTTSVAQGLVGISMTEILLTRLDAGAVSRIDQRATA